MIKIVDKSNCCGCEACVQVCPKQCINYLQDKEGFYYPEVDTDTCINCGLCEKVCPELHPYDDHTPKIVLSAINNDDSVRETSSSGGVFTFLAEQIIKRGGVVFGVLFDNEWQAVFDFADTLESVRKFRGSKYIQARVGNSYVQCKQFLDSGRQVLFTGTQCQIAALNHYLRKSYSNLLTVDFVCHGVPSPKVWKKYLEEAVSAGKTAISDINFRDKRNGWTNFNFVLDYKKVNNTYTLTSLAQDNPFFKAFKTNLILRPSCYSCPAKRGKSHSDITIADFWGINVINPKMYDDKGTSLVMINTEKGDKAWKREGLSFECENYEEAIKYNPSILSPAILHPKRALFFNSFSDDVEVHKLFSVCLRPSMKQQVREFIRVPLQLARRLLKRKTGVKM